VLESIVVQIVGLSLGVFDRMSRLLDRVVPYKVIKYRSLNNVDVSHCEPTPSPLSANRRPIFPKQRQLQKRTLAIQVATPMLSSLTTPALMGQGELPTLPESFKELVAGAGTILGLTPRRRAAPVRPTTVERRKPALVRSMRYQSTGLTRARVRET
jgi:hypothetical protein